MMVDEERNYAWKRAKLASKLLNIDIYNHIKQVHSGVWQVGSKVDGDMRNRACLAGLRGPTKLLDFCRTILGGEEH